MISLREFGIEGHGMILVGDRRNPVSMRAMEEGGIWVEYRGMLAMEGFMADMAHMITLMIVMMC
jgi:hypothetical protein